MVLLCARFPCTLPASFHLLLVLLHIAQPPLPLKPHVSSGVPRKAFGARGVPLRELHVAVDVGCLHNHVQPHAQPYLGVRCAVCASQCDAARDGDASRERSCVIQDPHVTVDWARHAVLLRARESQVSNLLTEFTRRQPHAKIL